MSTTNKGLDFSINKHFFVHYNTAVPVQDAKVYSSFTDKYGFPQAFDTNSKFNGFLHSSAKAVIDFMATLVDPEATVDPIVRQIVNMLRTNFVTLDIRYPQHIPGKVYNGVVNITPLDFDNSNNPRVKEVGSMLKNFLFDHDVDDSMILQLMQGVQQVSIKLKSEHVIVQDEVKGYDKPKPAANVANTEDKLAQLAADREARRLARQSQLDNDSGSNSNPTEEQINDNPTPTEEQINDNPTPTEEQINDAYNKLQAFVKAKTDLDADPTKADSKKTYNKALAALKATDQGLYANLSEEDKTAYQAALTATNA